MSESMSESRIRIKFGEHEFEAEGPAESVERQFAAFKQLVAPDPQLVMQATRLSGSDTAPVALEKIVRIRGRIVSLSVTAKAEDAVLVLLLGQRQFRKNDIVSGSQVMRGLRDSGLRIPRADTILAKHARDGYVIAMGARRLRRYRLSSAGVDRAEQIARQLISLVP
jgi:predicted nucleic acid-binding protein